MLPKIALNAIWLRNSDFYSIFARLKQLEKVKGLKGKKVKGLRLDDEAIR
jgi:hypothetical protein